MEINYLKIVSKVIHKSIILDKWDFKINKGKRKF